MHSRRAGLWVLREALAGGSVPISALDGAALEVDLVYEGVELEAPPSATRAIGSSPRVGVARGEDRPASSSLRGARRYDDGTE
ncbi:MAG: hypothetical protein R3A52_27890 [Polyangiales bacterium]